MWLLTQIELQRFEELRPENGGVGSTISLTQYKKWGDYDINSYKDAKRVDR